MGNIIEKMRNHPPKGFFGFRIFLPADMTVFSMYCCSAIKAIFLFSFRAVGHAKNFLKISTKNTNIGLIFESSQPCQQDL